MGVTHHNGLSVWGSGLWKGKGGTVTSGTAEYPFFGQPVAGAGSMGATFCDGGKTNVSGVAFAVSTNLSTILAVFATPQTSGLANVFVVGSGNCIDIVCRSMSGTLSSGVIAWLAVGY